MRRCLVRAFKYPLGYSRWALNKRIILCPYSTTTIHSSSSPTLTPSLTTTTTGSPFSWTVQLARINQYLQDPKQDYTQAGPIMLSLVDFIKYKLDHPEFQSTLLLTREANLTLFHCMESLQSSPHFNKIAYYCYVGRERGFLVDPGLSSIEPLYYGPILNQLFQGGSIYVNQDQQCEWKENEQHAPWSMERILAFMQQKQQLGVWAPLSTRVMKRLLKHIYNDTIQELEPWCQYMEQVGYFPSSALKATPDQLSFLAQAISISDSIDQMSVRWLLFEKYIENKAVSHPNLLRNMYDRLVWILCDGTCVQGFNLNQTHLSLIPTPENIENIANRVIEPSSNGFVDFSYLWRVLKDMHSKGLDPLQHRGVMTSLSLLAAKLKQTDTAAKWAQVIKGKSHKDHSDEAIELMNLIKQYPSLHRRVKLTKGTVPDLVKELMELSQEIDTMLPRYFNKCLPMSVWFSVIYHYTLRKEYAIAEHVFCATLDPVLPSHVARWKPTLPLKQDMAIPSVLKSTGVLQPSLFAPVLAGYLNASPQQVDVFFNYMIKQVNLQPDSRFISIVLFRYFVEKADWKNSALFLDHLLQNVASMQQVGSIKLNTSVWAALTEIIWKYRRQKGDSLSLKDHLTHVDATPSLKSIDPEEDPVVRVFQRIAYVLKQDYLLQSIRRPGAHSGVVCHIMEMCSSLSDSVFIRTVHELWIQKQDQEYRVCHENVVEPFISIKALTILFKAHIRTILLLKRYLEAVKDPEQKQEFNKLLDESRECCRQVVKAIEYSKVPTDKDWEMALKIYTQHYI